MDREHIDRYDRGAVWKRGAEPGLLSEAINEQMAFRRDAARDSLTEDALTFRCIRCGHRMRAREAILTRTATEVVYECPRDRASLVTIHDQDLSFVDGELTIQVDGHAVDWWEFVTEGEP
jgi:hypothetical protein